MTERPHTTDASSPGLTRRTFMKAAGAAGVVAAAGSTQAAASEELDEETIERVGAPQLQNAPEDLAIGSVIPHRRVGPDIRGGYHTNAHWGIHFETDRPTDPPRGRDGRRRGVG
ncbi:MAG: twin-arginine translocation signal domain-containing protein [Halalkalicoccus sp.]